jgi:amidase
MAVQVPTPGQLAGIAAEIGLDLSAQDIDSFIELLKPNIAAYNVVDALPDHLPPVKYPRTPGYRPVGAENPYNAWYVKSTVEGAPSGRLKGKTVVLKDNIMLAGVPMMNGAATLEGYVPYIDATVVTRILDAGGTIMGKAHCEYFCLSGGSHTGAAGAVHNPHKHGYSAGGSSSGSAALVAAGEVDMALGGDQGGSIRMPAAFCGIYGMKPTHGLVPYTGIMPIEIYVDHTGPMTGNVSDNALFLEVLAGSDGYDPRQYNVKTHPYSEMLEGGVAGMKIAVVREGFGHPNSEEDVDQKVKAAVESLAGLGAQVDEVSIPMHLQGLAIWMPIGRRHHRFDRHLLRRPGAQRVCQSPSAWRLRGITEEYRRLNVLNYEMVAGTLFKMGAVYGFAAGCVCGVVAQRTAGERIVLEQKAGAVEHAINIAVRGAERFSL